MFTIVIPAYNPSQELITLIHELLPTMVEKIIIVNDGSTGQSLSIFEKIKHHDKVVILTNAINMGKGAALKVGLNYAYVHYPMHVGVITADADGQHLPTDILKVYEKLTNHNQSLIVGVRQFRKDVPLRSRFGNILTKKLFTLLVGRRLSDTQSGLRGIPMSFVPRLLKINSNGYEFELDMLLSCKYTHREIVEESITTVYLDNNSSSHFNPILDSLKIYFVLFRFTLLSIITATFDYIVFIILSSLGVSIFASQFLSRLFAITFNYPLVKNVVFCSNEKDSSTFFKYISLVFISGTISLVLIEYLHTKLGITIVVAKVIAESVIYLANFTVQRDLIFTTRTKYAN